MSSHVKVFLFGALSAFVLALIFMLGTFTYGWTNPTGDPPTGTGAVSYYNGKVGVGTTTPAALFTVATSSTSNYFAVKNTGNVGVATSSPGYLFTVASSTNGRGLAWVTEEGRMVLSASSTDYCAGLGCGSDKLNIHVWSGESSPEAIWIWNQGAGSAGISSGILVDQSSTATTNRAIFINSTGSGTNNYGMYFNSISGATSNYGIYFNGPSAATNNYAIYNGAGSKIYTAGDVGINITTPQRNLHVYDSATGELVNMRLENAGTSIGDSVGLELYARSGATSGIARIVGVSTAGPNTDIAFYTNLVNTVSQTMLIDADGFINIDLATTATTNGLCHSGTDADVALAATDPRNVVVCSAAPGDIAEWYETGDDVEIGELVAVAESLFEFEEPIFNPKTGETTGEKAMRKVAVFTQTFEPYQPNLIGVVSESPYQTFGHSVRDAEHAKNARPIALSGRVPVKVTLENGPIKPGDLLTSSSKPGYAMKAIKSGRVIGMALEPFQGAENKKEGGAMAFVNPHHWVNPEEYKNLRDEVDLLKTEIAELKK